MKSDMAEIAWRYGFPVIMTSAGAPNGLEFYAYLEPIDSEKIDKTDNKTRAGRHSREYFLLMAAMDSFSAAERGAKIECEGQTFELIRAERQGAEGAFTHWEGVMRRCGKAESDG